MHSLLSQQAKYNLWANESLIDRINEADSSTMDKKVKSSFDSIRKTLGHIYDAEKIWLNRLGGTSLANWPSQNLELFKPELLLNESQLLIDFVEKLNEQEFNKICTYENRSGEKFDQKVWEILMHVFNHSTYHRGQIITILREFGEESLPSTDLIRYLGLERS